MAKNLKITHTHERGSQEVLGSQCSCGYVEEGCLADSADSPDCVSVGRVVLVREENESNKLHEK